MHVRRGEGGAGERGNGGNGARPGEGANTTGVDLVPPSGVVRREGGWGAKERQHVCIHDIWPYQMTSLKVYA